MPTMSLTPYGAAVISEADPSYHGSASTTSVPALMNLSGVRSWALFAYNTSALAGKRVTGISSAYATYVSNSNIPPETGYNPIQDQGVLAAFSSTSDINSITFNTFSYFYTKTFNPVPYGQTTQYLDGTQPLYSYFFSGYTFGIAMRMFGLSSTGPYYTTAYTTNPGLIVTYDDWLSVSPQIQLTNRYINPSQDFSIGCSYTQTFGNVGTIEAVSGVLELYSSSNVLIASYTLSNTGFTNVVIPAGTLSNDGLNSARVSYVAGGKTFTVSKSFSTVDDVRISTAISPKNEFKSVNEDITFLWTSTNSYSSNQTAAGIQYNDGAGWIDLAHVEGDTEQYIAPADTLGAGTISWRVRTYNNDGVVGEWSTPVSFSGSGKPRTAVINDVSDSNFPVVYWSSTGQVSYELRAFYGGNLIYYSGEIYTSDRQHKIDTPLIENEYTIELRIKNADSLYSDWAVYTFNPPVVQSSTVTLTGVAYTANNLLQWTYSGTNTLYLYRNNVKIADITMLTNYADYLAAANSTYFIYEVDPNGIIFASNSITLQIKVQGAILASQKYGVLPINMRLKNAGDSDRSATHTTQFVESYFYGYDFPTALYMNRQNSQYNIGFVTSSRQIYANFIEIYRQREDVIYRDEYGNVFAGVITNVQSDVYNSVYDVNFTLLRTNNNG